MKINLTIIEQPTRIVSTGETKVGSAEVQPARDNQLKATNCRADGGLISTIPLSQPKKAILSFPMPKKTLICQRQISKNRCKHLKAFVQFTLNQYNRNYISQTLSTNSPRNLFPRHFSVKILSSFQILLFLLSFLLFFLNGKISTYWANNPKTG